MKPVMTLQTGLKKLAWLPFVTGILAIALGIWCLCDPTSSLVVFAYVFAGALCFSGVLNILLGISNKSTSWNWGWALSIGIIEIFCGVWMYTLPTLMITSVFMFVIGIWILVAAINALCESFMMASRSVVGAVFSVLLLLATIVFAIIFMANPISGGIAVWLYIGLSLIFFGCYRIIFAATMRKISNDLPD